MAQHDSNSKADGHAAGTVEMPRPTAWPIALSLGILLVALGVATNLFFCIVGGVLFLVSLVGWISQLMPGQGHEHESLTGERGATIVATAGTVEQLRPGVTGYRFQLPQKVHPISAGIKGGILGGLLMPIPALIWALMNGHSIWYPVNLLAGLVLPGLADMPAAELHANLEMFHPWGLLCAIIMHATLSIGFGLVGGVLLPTLPPVFGGPLLFGGVILPLLWSGANHSLMGLVNPLLNKYIDWPWYVASQLVYGIVTSIVIIRSEKIAIAPRGEGSDRGGPSIPPGWLSCLLIACCLLSGCNDKLPGKPLLADAYVMPQQINDFGTLYAQRCAGCHGADGTLGPGPPLNDPLFATLISEDDLKSVIASGRHGTLMPAWANTAGGPLTDDQVAVLVKGIKQQKWDSAADSKTQKVYPSAPPLTAANGTKGTAKAGEKVYALACAACHGNQGEGVHEVARAINDKAFLSLCSDEQMRRYIITGRPDLGMPNFAEDESRGSNFKPLTSQQVSDLVALLAQWREKANAE